MKTFDSKWLKIRAEDTQLTLELTPDGGRRLQSMLVSSTTDTNQVRYTKWKVSEEFTLATLFGEMGEEIAISIASAWIDLKDKELIHGILDEMLWGDGVVTLRDRNMIKEG